MGCSWGYETKRKFTHVKLFSKTWVFENLLTENWILVPGTDRRISKMGKTLDVGKRGNVRSGKVLCPVRLP